MKKQEKKERERERNKKRRWRMSERTHIYQQG